jgi:integrase/recombinase XerD
MPSRRDHDELSKLDVEQILYSAAASQEDHLFLLLLARTGRRIGELLELRVKDIDPEEKCIWTKIEKRRDQQRRKMFIDNITLSALEKFAIHHNLKNDDKLFLKSKRYYQRLPEKYADAGKYFTCHSFRHYFITSLIKKGWSYDAIQKLTGHVSIASLRAYDHAEIEVVEDRFRAIEW